MASRWGSSDVTDGIGHGEDGQSEGKRYAEQANAALRKGRSDHCINANTTSSAT